MTTALPRHSRISGTGSYLPPDRVSNADLAARLAKDGIETSDEWIVERTGIRFRHFAAPDVAVSDLALIASRRALEAADCDPGALDLIIVATSTPDMVFPSSASILQAKLGVAGCAAFDVQAVCSGFVYALTVADSMIKTGAASKALVVGAEVFSRILDFKDRTTCVLFGDGAGAVVLEASATPGILATELHADGRYVDILCVPGHVSGGKVLGDPLLKMDGPAVFKLAVGVLESVARSVLEKAGRKDADIDWLIPHQANIRIMQSTAKKLKLAPAKLIATVDRHGNTSAASIPLALDESVREGKIKRGDTVMLEGVGGGFTWGAALLDLLGFSSNDPVRFRLSRSGLAVRRHARRVGRPSRGAADARRGRGGARPRRRPPDPRRPEGAARPDDEHPAGDAGRRGRLLSRLAGRDEGGARRRRRPFARRVHGARRRRRAELRGGAAAGALSRPGDAGSGAGRHRRDGGDPRPRSRRRHRRLQAGGPRHWARPSRRPTSTIRSRPSSPARGRASTRPASCSRRRARSARCRSPCLHRSIRR